MNRTELEERVFVLSRMGGWADALPNPDYRRAVAEGLKLFSTNGQYLSDDTTLETVSGQAEYSLLDPGTTGPLWVLVTDVLWGTNRELLPTAEAKLRSYDPLWTKAQPGTPTHFFIAKPNVLRLYVPPNIDNQTLYIHGFRCEPDLTRQTSVPLAPDVFHEGIALYGAWYLGKATARGEERVVLKEYLSEASDYAQQCKAWFEGQNTAAFQRRVKRRLPEYVSLGSGLHAGGIVIR